MSQLNLLMMLIIPIALAAYIVQRKKWLHIKVAAIRFAFLYTIASIFLLNAFPNSLWSRSIMFVPFGFLLAWSLFPYRKITLKMLWRALIFSLLLEMVMKQGKAISITAVFLHTFAALVGYLLWRLAFNRWPRIFSITRSIFIKEHLKGKRL